MSEEERKSPLRKSPLRGGVEFLLMLAVSFALVFGFVRPVVASPVFVDSGSMIPALQIHDRLLMNKLADDFSEPERGDIVLFDDPAGGETPLIKRAIGLPGETVELRAGDLFINGAPVEEPYVNDSAPPTSFGPVPEESLIGEALFGFWPPGRFGSV